MGGTGAERSLRPFPAIDAEPPSRLRRLTALPVRWAAAVVCLLAAGATAGALTWPWTNAPARHAASTPFADQNGLVVFEQQPSGALGIARPDGSHAALRDQLGVLQGNDLAVASADGRYLATNEAQVVTLGAAGPLSIAFTPMTSQLQADLGTWQGTSFAAGGRYLVAAECANTNVAPYWQVRLVPTTGSGTGSVLGTVDAAYDSQGVAGDPRSPGAFVVPWLPQNPQSVTSCIGPLPPPGGDGGVLLERPGQPARPVVTAAAVRQALGAPAGTSVLLSVYPSLDGSLLAVTAASFTPVQSSYGPTLDETSLGIVVVTRTGKVMAKLVRPVGFPLRWSPDGSRIAIGMPSVTARAPEAVLVWPLAGQPATITLSGHRREFFTQLLWSPDGTQLIVAVGKATPTLRQADALVPGWTVVDLRTRQAHEVTVPGQPAAWLPGQGTGR